MRRLLTMLMLSVALTAGPAWAQDDSGTRTERPATASYWGDTGLWFIPTAETVKSWSFSLYRTEFDFKQGLTDVSDWPLTASAAAGPRTEVFGALRVVTRIDRDLRPLFEPGLVEEGGVINDRPFVRETWTGNDLGDLFFGAKVNLLTEHNQHPLALAFRGTAKAPTADEEKGAGTGEWDFFTDVVASKEVGRRVEVSGFGGYAFRGEPDGFSLSDGVRWGAGAAFGARANLRVTAEVFGEHTIDDAVIGVPGLVEGTDGSLSPAISDLETGVTTALGVTWQHSSGVSLGAGVTYQFGLEDDNVAALGLEDRNAWGMQFRIGFHRGVRLYVPPAPPRVAAAPQPAPPLPPLPPITPLPVENRPPTVKAICNPCRIEVGQATVINADSQDPDGDKVTFRWSTITGTLEDPRALSTKWVAETIPGTVVLTVTAEDGRGGVATDAVNVEVVRRPPLVLDEVYFDLDQDTLRPDGIAVLNKVVEGLKQNPMARVRIEGHTSNEASEIYNIGLGERRAQRVQEYLTTNGVSASQLQTTSLGETSPKYDNSKEETRQLNRRAAFVVIEQ